MVRVSTFGERLKELRTAMKLSQSQLEADTEVPRANITRWEAGGKNPKVEHVMILAEFFQVTVGYLLGYDE